MPVRILISAILSVLVSSIAMAQAPALTTKTSRGYLLGPGDSISVKVLGEKDFDFNATVDENGKIEVPYAEKAVVAKCRTESEVGADVKAIYSKVIRNPQINFVVTERKSRPPVVVYGEVHTPHEVVLTGSQKATLASMLALSAGTTEQASGVVQIFRTQQPVCQEDIGGDSWRGDSTNPDLVPTRFFSLSDLDKGGEFNPNIYPGDIISVLRALPVYITGEVVAPQGIYLRERALTLREAIAQIGGLRPEAKKKDIKIYRQKPNSQDREEISANFDLINKGQQPDIVLKPFDIVIVNPNKDSLGVTMLKFAIGLGKASITAAGTGSGYRVAY